ncbi:MAG: butyrate kinase [Motiliproteus sp.]|jgi:butyrate kinase
MEGAAFTPERAGAVPPIPLINASFSGHYSCAELKKKLYGEGGLYGYLGTRDLREVEARILQHDPQAKLIFDAMIYQIKKSMVAMASVLECELDGFILTGGIATCWCRRCNRG